MDTAATLSQLLGPLRRAVLRSARSAGNLPDLPDAQIELLRALAAHPGITPRAAATQLRMAPSTVSNLVKTMTASGLVERHPSPQDLRTVGLTATAAALDLLDRYDRTSTATLADAIAGLGAHDEEALSRALPVMERLLATLQETTDRTLDPQAVDLGSPRRRARRSPTGS
ncbi:MarR family winged helix-turn-helix transcriptional regulator [Streptomyces sp. NPDC005336]|uniref:MarR family winged helix-turn-helix transcriptional regulator n=1 Tax=Streptomyces sp. NPDC005336 TaxID=3157035 RepID=UPI0033A18367